MFEITGIKISSLSERISERNSHICLGGAKLGPGRECGASQEGQRRAEDRRKFSRVWYQDIKRKGLPRKSQRGQELLRNKRRVEWSILEAALCKTLVVSTRADRTVEKMCGCVLKGVCWDGVHANPLPGVDTKAELSRELEKLKSYGQIFQTWKPLMRTWSSLERIQVLNLQHREGDRRCEIQTT